MCATQKDRAARLFRGEDPEAGQFGVACPAGAERIIHRTRLEVARVLAAGAASPSRAAETSDHKERERGDSSGALEHEHRERGDRARGLDFVILKVDLKNAFNNVSRKAILQLVLKHFPEIARWVYWCYGRPGGQDPLLWFKEWILESKEGVQQGDPLGPLLFSMVIQELITAIATECKLALNLWYLDDGVLAGSAAQVHQAFLLIQRMGPELGLELNVGKTELVTFFDGTPDPFPKMRLGDDGAVLEQGVKRLRRNFDLLGSPIGDPEYCASFVSAFTEKAVRHTLEPLSSLDDPQVVHMLLRLCASFCRVVHLLRSVPTILCRDAIGKFDQAVRKAFSRGVGIAFPDRAWAQICLPFSWAGFGLRAATSHSSGAYLASVANAAAEDGWDASQAEGWAEAVADTCARTGWTKDVVCPGKPLKQRAVSEAIDKAMFKELCESSSLFDRARLLSQSGVGAGAWLGVIPSVELGYMFDSREFTTLLRFWLGQAVYDAPRACPGCGVAMDVFGYHALTCSHLGGLGVRHNKLRDVWLRYFKLAGIPAQKEAPSLLPGSAARPADIFVPHFLPPDADTAKQACLDFAVTHPQQPSTLKRAGEVCGYSANEYAETVKEAKFGGQCTAAGVVLVPMVVETFGRWDSRADEVFAFVAKGSGARAGAGTERAASFLRRSLAVCLQRCNVHTLLGRLDPNGPELDDPFEADEESDTPSVADELGAFLGAGCECAAGDVCAC
jgi:hypothetical protein